MSLFRPGQAATAAIRCFAKQRFLVTGRLLLYEGFSDVCPQFLHRFTGIFNFLKGSQVKCVNTGFPGGPAAPGAAGTKGPPAHRRRQAPRRSRGPVRRKRGCRKMVQQPRLGMCVWAVRPCSGGGLRPLPWGGAPAAAAAGPAGPPAGAGAPAPADVPDPPDEDGGDDGGQHQADEYGAGTEHRLPLSEAEGAGGARPRGGWDYLLAAATAERVRCSSSYLFRRNSM